MNEFTTSVNGIDCIVTVTNYDAGEESFMYDEGTPELFNFEIEDMQGNDLCEMITPKIEKELLNEYKTQIIL
jgi:hypothetical protein